ncbi:MAG: hypothetical protein JW904_14570 [Spirochaetales bacterium]|nr:hypothetical protein [Spirochaetales bacterium]
MKKIIVIALLLAIFMSGHLFAQKRTGWAVGGAFTFDWAAGNNTYVNGAALLFKTPWLPIMFGVSARFTEPDSAIGITADWWLVGPIHLIGPVNLYLGPGLYFWMIMNDQTDNMGFGMRIPLGFQIFIIPSTFEIFLEPALRIEFLPQLPDFGMQAALGFRFWF